MSYLVRTGIGPVVVFFQEFEEATKRFRDMEAATTKGRGVMGR